MARLDKDKQRALDLVMEGHNLFITGKAGTGKTHLLNIIRQKLQGKKVLAILAPTGIAAKNANGFTMHSFLRLPLKPYLPEHSIKPDLYNLTPSVAVVIRKLDILVIDEISMVRCDMLDATDMILRHYRRSEKPFGGIQIVMFGDLFQLCPVAVDDEWKTLKKYYQTPYFFSCYALKNFNYKVVELTKIYRQDNRKFIKLLNNVREGQVSLSDLSLLDSRLDKDYLPDVDDNVVTLMTHIKDVDKRNKTMLEELSGSEETYIGVKSGGWYGKRLPAPKELHLKVGARVMFVSNDNDMGDYQNGTMGRVTNMYYAHIEVMTDDGRRTLLGTATWHQYDYFVDEKTKTIYTQERATYKQFPLKLAWAVSIHKSQGLTFEKVAINASKAFAFGQVYVALSRCKTLEGIHLLAKIPYQKIVADPIVKTYMDSIDSDGNVILPDEFEVIKYENKPLIVYISDKKFERIYIDEIKNYGRAIDADIARQLFVWENGKPKVEKAFESIKRDWKYTDTYNGSCPFVIRKYNKVRFECRSTGLSIDCDIEGEIEVTPNMNGELAFKIRIGENRKIIGFLK